MVIEVPEQKFKANVAVNTTFDRNKEKKLCQFLGS